MRNREEGETRWVYPIIISIVIGGLIIGLSLFYSLEFSTNETNPSPSVSPTPTNTPTPAPLPSLLPEHLNAVPEYPLGSIVAVTACLGALIVVKRKSQKHP